MKRSFAQVEMDDDEEISAALSNPAIQPRPGPSSVPGIAIPINIDVSDQSKISRKSTTAKSYVCIEMKPFLSSSDAVLIRQLKTVLKDFGFYETDSKEVLLLCEGIRKKTFQAFMELLRADAFEAVADKFEKFVDRSKSMTRSQLRKLLWFMIKRKR